MNRNTLAMLVAAAVAVPGLLAAQDKATLTVEVVGVNAAKGKMEISLFKEPKGFPDTAANAIRHEFVDIDPQTVKAKVVWADLAPGVYAVAVHHDENGNGKMDTNIIGIPKEGHGASNNPKPARRPPTFEEAQFTLAAPAQTVEVKLDY